MHIAQLYWRRMKSFNTPRVTVKSNGNVPQETCSNVSIHLVLRLNAADQVAHMQSYLVSIHLVLRLNTSVQNHPTGPRVVSIHLVLRLNRVRLFLGE